MCALKLDGELVFVFGHSLFSKAADVFQIINCFKITMLLAIINDFFSLLLPDSAQRLQRSHISRVEIDLIRCRMITSWCSASRPRTTGGATAGACSPLAGT